MSSATSIKRTRSVPLSVESQTNPPDSRTGGDASFRPWHFFVLSALIAATVAVILSRRATPEHLVFISLAIGAVGVAAAAFYRTLAPLAAADAEAFSPPLSDRATTSFGSVMLVVAQRRAAPSGLRGRPERAAGRTAQSARDRHWR